MIFIFETLALKTVYFALKIEWRIRFKTSPGDLAWQN